MNDSECCCPICPLIGKRLDEEFRLEWDIKNNQLINKFCYSDNLDPIIYSSLITIILDIRNEVDFEEDLFGDHDFDDEEKGEISFQIHESLKMFDRLKKAL